MGRGQAESLLAITYWANGELAKAHDALAAAMAGFEKAGNINFAISGANAMADFRNTQGRLRDAVQTYEHYLRLATVADGTPLPATANLYLGLAEEAATYLQRSWEIGEGSALP